LRTLNKLWQHARFPSYLFTCKFTPEQTHLNLFQFQQGLTIRTVFATQLLTEPRSSVFNLGTQPQRGREAF